MINRKLKSAILAALLRKPGFPCTGKRIVVIDEVCRNPDFGDMEAIWLAVRESHGISRATVYNTITALVELGFIRKEKADSFGYLYYVNRYGKRHRP